MTEEPSELTEQEEPARPERQGKGLAKIASFTVTTADGEKVEPAVITTVHQPRPEPPPRWRPPQSAREEARKLRAQAQEADSKAAALERDFDSKIRHVESLNREIELKDRELQKYRQLMADLDSDKLGERLLEWY
jgi:chromosome segregation ATPase